MELQAVDIKRILPHRYPFLLVDRILEVHPGQSAVGMKCVSVNEEFFNGHFPGHPIMPGVLIVEMMAQVSGVMLLATPGNEGKLAYLAGVEKCRFRKPVLPGDTIVASITMVRARGSMGRVKAEGRVGNTLVCDAEMSFALVNPDYDDNQIMSGTRYHDVAMTQHLAARKAEAEAAAAEAEDVA